MMLLFNLLITWLSRFHKFIDRDSAVLLISLYDRLMTVHRWRNINIKQGRGQSGRLEEMTHNFLYVYFLKKLWIFPPLKLFYYLFFFSIKHFYSIEEEYLYKWNNIKTNSGKEPLASILTTKHSSSWRCSIRSPRRAELAISRIAHLSTGPGQGWPQLYRPLPGLWFPPPEGSASPG